MGVPDRTYAARLVEEGYVVVEGVLDPELDIRPVEREYAAILDKLAANWQAQGKLSSTYSELPFGERLMRIAVESGEDYLDAMDITPHRLPKAPGEPVPMHAGDAVFNLLRSPRLLDVLETILGPEIYSNPIQHARIKAPERQLSDKQKSSLAATQTWHQDQAATLPEADQTNLLTVWVAINDATLDNGCLQLVPRSYLDGLAPHCPETTIIPEGQLPLERAIPVPVKSGGVIIMHRLTMHASLPNVSDNIRWSFDLRYNPIDQPSGRSFYPGFVARSRLHPEREVRDADTWRASWRDQWDRLGEMAVRGEVPTFIRSFEEYVSLCA